jgi:myosin heavy subunit
MSTLSKVFVILVFVIACVKLGIDATLFAQKVDWKDKFVKEVNYHYQTQQVKNSEIAAFKVELENRAAMLDILRQKVAVLDTELAGRSSRLSDTQRQLASADELLKKYAADQAVFVRQLEVQLAQLADMTDKVEGYRQKVVKINNEYSVALQELQYARQEAERLSRDLAEVESKVVELARDKRRYEEQIAAYAAAGVRTDLAPRKRLEGKVTAVSAQYKLVIINIGKDQGVLEGDEFTIYRDKNFVAKITIERVDRQWASGRIMFQKDDPRVADSVSNDILVTPGKGN